jgi:outer membrane protein assembly factor BamD (BamD/ComL family)
MQNLIAEGSPPAAESRGETRPDSAPSRRGAWRWLLVCVVVWVFAMAAVDRVAAPGRDHRAQAASALREATLLYIEDVSAEGRQEKLGRARAAFESVAARFADTEQGQVAQFYVIRTSYRLGDYERAERDAEAFIERGRDPDDYIIRSLEVLYQIHDARGDQAGAREYFNRMIEANLR